MKNRTALAIVLLLIIASFALGMASVLANSQMKATPAGPDTRPSSPPIAGAQTTVLILGIDKLDTTDPRLMAVWVLTYRQPASNVFLLGLPLDYMPASGGEPLGQRFAYDGTANPAPSFLQAIAEAVPLPLDAIALLDQQAYAAVVDFAGGIELNGSHLSGQQVISVFSLLENDPKALLRTQEQILQALAQQGPQLSPAPDLSPLLALLPEHAALSVPVSTFTNLLIPVLSLGPDAIHIDLPDLKPATPAAAAGPPNDSKNACLSNKVRLC
jgi:hypothetical protein